MGMFMMAVGNQAKLMGMAYSHITMEANTKDTGKMTKKMVTVSKHGLTEIDTKDNIKME